MEERGNGRGEEGHGEFEKGRKKVRTRDREKERGGGGDRRRVGKSGGKLWGWERGEDDRGRKMGEARSESK